MTELQGFSGRRIKKQFPNFKHKYYSLSDICETFQNNEIKNHILVLILLRIKI